jgi:hypothetical protein
MNRVLGVIIIISLSVLFFIISGCKNEKKDVPLVITYDVSEVTSATATCGGEVSEDYGMEATKRGVCWSTNHNPTISDNYTQDGLGKGVFISNLTGLVENTTYFVRAYATNNAGTGYGSEKSFVTPEDYRKKYTGSYSFTIIKAFTDNFWGVTYRDTSKVDGTISIYINGDFNGSFTGGYFSDLSAGQRLTIIFGQKKLTPIITVNGSFTAEMLGGYYQSGYFTNADVVVINFGTMAAGFTDDYKVKGTKK